MSARRWVCEGTHIIGHVCVCVYAFLGRAHQEKVYRCSVFHI